MAMLREDTRKTMYTIIKGHLQTDLTKLGYVVNVRQVEEIRIYYDYSTNLRAAIDVLGQCVVVSHTEHNDLGGGIDVTKCYTFLLAAAEKDPVIQKSRALKVLES
jgi:hypothetical protein